MRKITGIILIILLAICLSISGVGATITPNPTSWVQYIGDGTQTIFPYTWKVYATTDLVVIVTDATGDHVKALTTDYGVTGVGASTGGNVVFTTPPSGTVTISLSLLLRQDLHYVPNAPFPAATSEIALDRLAMELRQYVARTPLLDNQKPLRDVAFPPPAPNSIIGWDSSGTGLQTYQNLSSVAVPNIDYLGNYGNSLATAVTTIGNAATLLQVTVGTAVTADVIIPKNITLWPTPAGVITVANGATLTINGPLEASPYQIFSCSSTGKVVFGPDSAKSLYPEWWGAKADNATDSSVAMTACLVAAIDSGIEVKWASGTYKINSSVAATMAAGKTLTVSGSAGTVIDCSGITYSTGYNQPDVWGLAITGTPSTDPNNVVRLSNFKMIGGATDLGGLTGLRLDGVGQTILTSIIATGFPAMGIKTADVGFITAIGCNCSFNYQAGAHFGGQSTDADLTKSRGVRVFSGEYNSNGCGKGPAYDGLAGTQGIGYGLIANAQQVAIFGARCVSNDRYGIDFRGGSDVVVDGCYVYDSGLEGIHGSNYNIAPNGSVNVKIVNNTVDNNDRTVVGNIGGLFGINVGSESPQGTDAVPVDQILISGNTIKRTVQQAIYVPACKLPDGSTSLKKLIITNNQVQHTDQTDTAANNLIFTGFGGGTDYIDSAIIKDNQLENGGIYSGNGLTVDISGNSFYYTGAGAFHYPQQVIQSTTTNTIINYNKIDGPLLTWTINPFFHGAGGTYTGLANIREMKGNVVNGDHPAGLWDWVYNGGELSFKWASSVAANSTRACLDLTFSGASRKGVSLSWDSSGQSPSTAYLVNSKHLEPIKIDAAGTVVFQGASVYTSTPYITSHVGAGADVVVWKLTSGTNTFNLGVTPNYDTDLLVDVSCRYSGTISAITVTDPGVGPIYTQ